ncbi:hypothetical protein DFH08DRAFT_842197 [Mycena albidolilacea]|uniref:Uncharacterized protein n=1 Tax=Mycena albidolilacea TaxID=1033008 RepID=A0AAD7AJX9_9AGAR|nr:hypothetical protein DFH08DRAFT_842197 [Mycena albidolilacea]
MNNCSDINECRTLVNIIWSCLATTGLCIWAALHLNVPSPGRGYLVHTWLKLRMMLTTLIAPELMLGLAARQYVVAHWFTETYNLSLTHGFFFAMGGFVTRDGDIPLYPIQGPAWPIPPRHPRN